MEIAPRARPLVAVVSVLVVAGCHEGSTSGPCSGVDCSGHGTCVEEGSSGSCVCHEGYEEQGLDCVLAEADGDADSDADTDGGSDADAETGGTVRDVEFCDRLAEVLCEARLACCTAAVEDGETRASCRAAVLPECTASLGMLVLDPEMGYDSARAWEELEEARSLAIGEGEEPSCDPGLVEWAYSAEGLYAILQGTYGVGQLCGGLYEPTNNFKCGPDLACWPVGGESRCRALSEGGEPCFNDLECIDGYFCGGAGVLPGDCVAAGDLGAECRENRQCQSSYCEMPEAGTIGACAPPDREAIYCAGLFALEGRD